jgi:antitoxin component YwqK of YwqJK toxin-antitoxin module
MNILQILDIELLNLIVHFVIHKDSKSYISLLLVSREVQNRTNQLIIPDNYKSQFLKTIERYEYGCKIIETLRVDVSPPKQHGQHLMYYNNDNLYIDVVYVNGQLHGRYLMYHKNCQLWIDTTYTNSQLHGRYLEYYNNDNLYIDAVYVNGQLHGQYLRYYENGQICKNAIYINGDKVCNL